MMGLEINESVGIQESYQIMTRTYFSIQHIQSAALFCRLCKKTEDKYNDVYIPDLSTELKAYVTSTVFTCASFLEATINELFCDASDSPKKLEFLGNKRKLLANMWSMDIPRTASYKITEKYQIALTLLDKPLFDKGQTPFQDVSALINLRNALIHYEPESFVCNIGKKTENKDLDKISKQLINKFDESKLFKNSGNYYFPNKCLGYGCAKWAVLYCIKFVDEFSEKIGKEPPYNHVRDKLKVE